MSKEKNIIFGIHPVIEAFEAGTIIEKLYVLTGSKGYNLEKIEQMAKQAGTAVNYVPIYKLNKLTPKNHQGVVAITSPIVYHDLSNIVQTVFEKGENPFILILDRITDVRNIGAIARSANAFGVHAIVVPQKGTALINSEAIKSSAGALNHIPVCREQYLDISIRELKDQGLTIIACTEKTNHKLTDLQISGPKAIIMGSEENGISPKYIKLADYLAKINMVGNVGSLNVSVATGIILHHLANK